MELLELFNGRFSTLFSDPFGLLQHPGTKAAGYPTHRCSAIDPTDKLPSKCHLIQYLQTSSRSTIIHHPSSMGLEVPWPSLAPCSTASRGLSCSSPAPLVESKKNTQDLSNCVSNHKFRFSIFLQGHMHHEKSTSKIPWV